MERVMRQMGMKVSELEDVREVVIRMEGEEIVITEPSVSMAEIQGQRIYQISGKEEKRMVVREEDIALVIEQTGARREEAERVLRETGGDLAESILRLRRER
jgi:nascent polypeptide-associated complex subunit alpha